ncbi:hypothetical protein GF325_04705 [Candidatus Bathyarchaeota archaeon]|nr:hypothetical protein [Candidatus Bathyarchaeota archaeon]
MRLVNLSDPGSPKPDERTGNITRWFSAFGRKLKGIKFLDIARAGIVAWAAYFFTSRFIANILLQVHGVSVTYTAFYWLVDGFLLAITLLYAWKPRKLIAQVAMIGVFSYTGYAMTRLFIDQILVLHPAAAVVHGILVGFMALNLGYILGQVFKYLFSPSFRQKLSSLRTDQVISTSIIGAMVIGFLVTWIFFGVANAFPVYFIAFIVVSFVVVITLLSLKHRSKAYKIITAGTIVWLALTCWSYFGFSTPHVIEDPNQAEFSYAFWGSPSGGLYYYHNNDYNETWYGTPELDAELTMFSNLNATFYNTINIDRLGNASTEYYNNLTNIELTLEEWESYGLNFIFDITPLNNETGEPRGDYVSYYYLEQMNDTINVLMDWLEPLNLTNFRGISFDVEGPKYGDNQPISEAQYRRALVSYGGILSEFKSRFPDSSIHLIQMEGILFDFFDGDHDLDIGQRTVSTELEWDWYGFMTYHVNPSPSASSYRYAYYMDVGIEQFGMQFQPWVGWWYDADSIDQPGVYDQSLEHVKIAKSRGVREVVLAPVRNFIGQDHNHTKIMARLGDLLDIKNGFETFTIPIHHDMRLLQDWDLYWEKIVPNYLITNNNVLKDLLIGTPGGWFAWIQLAVVSGPVVILLWIYDRKHA